MSFSEVAELVEAEMTRWGLWPDSAGLLFRYFELIEYITVGKFYILLNAIKSGMYKLPFVVQPFLII